MRIDLDERLNTIKKGFTSLLKATKKRLKSPDWEYLDREFKRISTEYAYYGETGFLMYSESPEGFTLDDGYVKSGDLYSLNWKIGTGKQVEASWLAEEDTNFFTPRSKIMTVDKLKNDNIRNLYKNWLRKDNNIIVDMKPSSPCVIKSGRGNDRINTTSNSALGRQIVSVNAGPGDDEVSASKGSQKIYLGNGSDKIYWKSEYSRDKCIVMDFNPKKDVLMQGGRAAGDQSNIYNLLKVRYSSKYNGPVFENGLILAELGSDPIMISISQGLSDSQNYNLLIFGD